MERHKIVYIIHHELDQTWLERLNLDELQETFDIEYWDCSDILVPCFKTQNPVARSFVLRISDRDTFIQALNRLPADTLVAVDIPTTPPNRFYRHLIARRFRTVIGFDFFANQRESRPRPLIVRLYRRFRPRRYRQKRLVIGCGADAPYPINHPDYETYRKLLREQPETSETAVSNYFVYIDNFFPLHQDIRRKNPNLDVDKIARDFYRSLNSYFDRVERRFGCSVIVAAHPSAMYRDNPFGGRRLVWEQTGRLIRDAQAVLMHTSNSFSYVLLFNKPFVFLHNEAYRQVVSEYRRLRFFAAAVQGCPCLVLQSDTLNTGALKMTFGTQAVSAQAVDTDCSFKGSEADFPKLPPFYLPAPEYREAYIAKYLKHSESSNAELMTRYLNDIYRFIGDYSRKA